MHTKYRNEIVKPVFFIIEILCLITELQNNLFLN